MRGDRVVQEIDVSIGALYGKSLRSTRREPSGDGVRQGVKLRTGGLVSRGCIGENEVNESVSLGVYWWRLMGGVEMSGDASDGDSTEGELAGVLSGFIADGFNRALGVLVDAGALDVSKLQTH